MAIAPPLHREVEILVLSDLRLGSRYARAATLLVELDRTRVATLILLGSPIADTGLDPGALPPDDRRLLETFEQMAAQGTRVYCLGRSWRSTGRGVGPRPTGREAGGRVQFRDELHFRIDGVDTLFLSSRLPRWHRRFDRWIDACGALSQLWAERLRRRRDRGFAQALDRLAVERGAVRLLLPFANGEPGTRLQGALRDVRLQVCGSWALTRTLAEYRFGRWALRDLGIGASALV